MSRAKASRLATRARALAACCLLSGGAVPARLAATALDGPALAPAPGRSAVGVVPHPGAVVPAGLAFTDSDGHPVRLGDAFGGPPVLLVLGYYRCTQMCGVVAQGVLEALHDSGLPPLASRLVFVSIDPQETPADAATRLKVDLDYARFLQRRDGAGGVPWLRLLTGPRTSIDALARAVGVVYRDASTPARDGAPATRGFAHPAAVIVLTPEGRVSRYIGGARFDPARLREAVAAAGDGDVGASPPSLILQCLHLAERAGSRDARVMTAVRVAMAAVAALLFAAALAFQVRRVRHARNVRLRDRRDSPAEGSP